MVIKYAMVSKYINSPEKSPQSLSESHLNEFGIHRPLAHCHSSGPQEGLVQFWSSSLLSRQSSSPSHIQVLGIHLWLSQVKSQALGQALTGGSVLGSPSHVLPSLPSFSPYGQPHTATVLLPLLSGTGKHNLLQPPLLMWHG